MRLDFSIGAWQLPSQRNNPSGSREDVATETYNRFHRNVNSLEVSHVGRISDASSRAPTAINREATVAMK
jgi:hypothetical protein